MSADKQLCGLETLKPLWIEKLALIAATWSLGQEPAQYNNFVGTGPGSTWPIPKRIA